MTTSDDAGAARPRLGAGGADSFQTQWRAWRRRVEQVLTAYLDAPQARAPRLREAMGHACLNGGKRFRAALVYACGEFAGAPPAPLDAAAGAVEMIHAYSLAHDDLPAMDDDALRRGKPACHVAYGEATAILAGDALQARAFEILSSPEHNPAPPEVRALMVRILAGAGGADGMAGGQALDMEATGRAVSAEQLATIHQLKTGALIRAAAALGAAAAPDADDALRAGLDRYAADLGCAFQVQDDVLDAAAESETLGKPAGADAELNKATYVSLLGLEGARAEARRLSASAVETIDDLSRDLSRDLGDNAHFPADFLQALARFAVRRRY